MKVLSVKADGFITVGKMYDILSKQEWCDHIFYQIINDNEQSVWYDENYFKNISEIRKEKINKINNED